MKPGVRSIRQLALAAIFAVGICSAGHAQLTPVAYDGFNYSAGSLSGQNGGSGWTGAWTNDYNTSGNSFYVTATGMSYPGLTNSGGSMLWTSGGQQINEDSRTLPLQNSGVVYFRFLCQFGPTSGFGTPNIRLLNSGALTGGFGGNGGTHGAYLSILDNTLSPAANGSSSSSSNLSSLNLVVARIDYQNTNTTMWVGPDLSTFNYQNPSTPPSATYAGLAPVFNGFSIFSRSPGQLDEISIFSVAGQTPTPVLNSPVSGSTYGSAGIAVSYALPKAPLGGSVQLAFTNNLHTFTLVLTNGTNASFVLSPQNPLASPYVVSTVPPSGTLPDGSYNVTLSYQDANADPVASVSVTNILVDTVTQSPMLLAPASNAVATSTGLHISYLLPETPAAGSVSITFQNSGTNITLLLDNSLANDFVISPASLTNAAVTSSTSPALPDGLYTVGLSYQDTNANPVAFATATNMLVDTVTLAPVLLTPASIAVVSSAGLHISYLLPETPTAGSVSITFQNASTNVTLFLNNSLANDFVVSPGLLTGAAAVASATSSVLPDGSYSVMLSYQDAYANPVATAAVTNILVDTVTQPPVLIAPANSAVVSSAGLHISYALPEAPAAGSVQITFQNSNTNVTLFLNNSLTNDFVVSPALLTGNPAVSSATSSALPDGRYTVSLEYQDAALNAAASATATNILVDTVTEPPLLLAPTISSVVSSAGLHIDYLLPETPTAGSVSITFQNSSTNITLFLNNSLTNDFVVSPASLQSAAAVTSATSPVLPDGNYTVSLGYQDAAFNAVASATVTNVLVDTVTLTPVLLAPATGSVVTSAGLHISYFLPETPAAGSVLITFQNSSTNVTLFLNNSLANDFVVNPASLPSAAAVISATSSALPDGRYTVSLGYQDAALNPSAQVQTTNVLVVLEPLNFHPTALAPSNGGFQFAFSVDVPSGLGFVYDMMSSTNLSTPSGNWVDLGPVTESPPGHFQFQDTRTNSPVEFYSLRLH